MKIKVLALMSTLFLSQGVFGYDWPKVQITGTLVSNASPSDLTGYRLQVKCTTGDSYAGVAEADVDSTSGAFTVDLDNHDQRFSCNVINADKNESIAVFVFGSEPSKEQILIYQLVHTGTKQVQLGHVKVDLHTGHALVSDKVIEEVI